MKLKVLYFLFALSATVNSFNISVSELSGNYLQDAIFESAARLPNITKPNTCQMQLLYLSKNWKKLNIFPMIDSWGKIPAGIMLGNLFEMGNFDECINFSTNLPKPLGQLEGQYCRAHIPLGGGGSGPEIEDTIDMMDRVGETRQESRALKLSLRAGICLPKSCKLEELQKMMPFQISKCKVKGEIPLEKLDYVTISISSVLGFLMLVGTAYDYLYKGPNKSPYLMAFSLPSNAEKLFSFSVGKQKNNIDCLNGIRVLSMMWVINGHSFASNMAIPKINLIDYLKWSRTFFSVFTDNAFISVDSFFFISGLLVSWIGMKEIEKRKGRINPFLMYLHRYLRLTPMLGYIMLFAMSLLKFFGNGPIFDDFLKTANDDCDVNWWKNLLYIQNYAAQPICLPQSWYLSIDFQLFLFSPLILFGFYRWGKKCFIGALVLIALSIGGIFATFYHYGIAGAMTINDLHGADRFNHYYKATHLRFSIWLIGMCFGYILHETKDKNVKIPFYIQIAGWIATAGILFGVVIAPFYTIHGYTYATSTLSAAFYESFSKIGWGLMLSWIVFACYHGYGGVVNSFLSNPLWQPFARLSFTMFLSHMIVISVIDGNSHTSNHFSNFDSFVLFWSHFGITVLVSIALVLAIESPLIGLEKTVFGGSKKENTEERMNTDIKEDA